jgi:hypothetical protein
VYARVILNRSPEGITALIVTIVFFAGVQMFFLGIGTSVFAQATIRP